jgi:hypothetical protein
VVHFQWFRKFFWKQAHKDWLEHVCHVTMHRTNSKRYLRISEISLVDLSNTSLLTGLDEFYSGRPAIAAVSPASMPSAAIAAAPPVIDDCPPSPSTAHQPAAAVAPCASQPVTNLDMLAHFGDLLLAFKKQRKWSSAKESVPLAHVTNSEDVSSWFGKYFRSPQHKTWLEHQSFISILGWSRGLRLIAINAGSRINLINTRGLLRLSSAVVCHCKGVCKAKFNLVRTSELERFCRPAVCLYRIVIISQHEIAVNEWKVVYQMMCSC